MLNKNVVQDHTEATLKTINLQLFAELPVDPPAPAAPPVTPDPPAPADPIPPTDPVPPVVPPTDPVKPPVDPAAPVIPEKYADFTLPEGFQMDAEALTEFMPLAKELGMTQEAAQKAIGLHTKAIGAIMGKIESHRDEAYKAVMTDIKADKTLGGQAYEANVGKINSVLENFGGKGVAETFHASIAQIAAHDPAQAKAMYTTLHAIAKAASVDNSLIMGMPRNTNGSELYPGLPNAK